MKKIYQLAATAVLAVLVIGASAQRLVPQSGFYQVAPGSDPAQAQLAKYKNNSGRTDRVASTTLVNGYLDNVIGDEVINNSKAIGFPGWIPFLLLNTRYTIADTGADVSGTPINEYTATSATVTFDTIFDFYAYVANNNVTLQDAPYPGSVTVDTISLWVHYKNLSTLNDTITVTINKVASNGAPTAATYGTTPTTSFAIIPPGPTATFKYNVLDSVQFLQIPLASPIVIPSSARRGWNFAVTVKMYNYSKQDSIGLYYNSPAAECGTSGTYLSSAYTSVGAPLGRASAVNSYVSGLYWYNDTKHGGNNTAVEFPLTSGSYLGACAAGNYLYSDFEISSGSCSGDTFYFPIQNIGVFPSISYNPAGINEVTGNSNFSINQNFPNPFNQNTEITYNLTKPSDVVFSVYDLTGRELVNNVYSTVAPGKHAITLQANQFTPGIYFYTFNVGGTQVTKKMIITQ